MKQFLFLFVCCICLQLQAQISPVLLNQFSLDDEFYPQSIAYYEGEIYMPDFFGNRIIKTSATTPNAPIVTVLSNINFPTGVQIVENELYFLQAFSTFLPSLETGKLSKINLLDSNPNVVEVLTGLKLPICLTGDSNTLFITEINASIDPSFPDDVEFESANISQIELTANPSKNTVFQNLGFVLDMKLLNMDLYWIEEFDDSERLIRYQLTDATPTTEELFVFSDEDYPEYMYLNDDILYYTTSQFNGNQDNYFIKAIDLTENQLSSFVVSEAFSFNTDEVYLASMVAHNNQLFIAGEAYNIGAGEETGLLYQLDISSLSIESVQDDLTLRMYPNPTHNQLFFSELVKDVQVYDLSGSLVIDLKTVNSTVDVSFLSTGMYLLKAKTLNGYVFQRKLVKR